MFLDTTEIKNQISRFYCAKTTSTTYYLALSFSLQNRKDQKKVDKLLAQIPYHEGRGNKEEVEKIRNQIDSIWEKTREAFNASLM